MGSVITRSAKYFNPLVMGIAENGVIPVWAVIVHTGRHSGRRFRTPIAIRPTADGFVIPLPFGTTDWCRNAMVGSDTVIRWKGRDYAVGPAEIIDRAAGAAAFPLVLRKLLGVLGVTRFLAVRRTDTRVRAA